MFCASCSSTPQLTTGGRRPRPRKLSAVSARIIAGIASVTEAMMWLVKRRHHVPRMMRISLVPSSRAAMTKSSLRQRQEPAADLARQRGPADQREMMVMRK